jgi:hypothetical protein
MKFSLSFPCGVAFPAISVFPLAAGEGAEAQEELCFHELSKPMQAYGEVVCKNEPSSSWYLMSRWLTKPDSGMA